MSSADSLSSSQRHILTAVQAAALAAVEPGRVIHRHLRRQGDTLWVGQTPYDLSQFERVLIVGGGKAAAPMLTALLEVVGHRVAQGLVITRYGHTFDAAPRPDVAVLQAGHPLPDAAGVDATRQLARLADEAGENDLVLCPISGGGSALMTLPAPGVELADLQALTDALLRAGAAINELNTVRKHLSQIKGGGLARLAAPATLIGLVLSDVIGDRLDTIASGPTTPDPGTFADAWEVLERHKLLAGAPEPVLERLRAGRAGRLAETPKPGDPIFERVQNVVVGSNRLAAEAAAQKAGELGLNPLLLSTYVEGEARQVARVAAALVKEMVHHGRPAPRPACLIWGGETTVTVEGSGRGGRNQELALAAAMALGQDLPPQSEAAIALVALATDGIDGPTDAAGAVVTGDTLARARRLGLDPQAALADNDAYPFFKALGDLILTGPTQTNVNDLLFLFVF